MAVWQKFKAAAGTQFELHCGSWKSEINGLATCQPSEIMWSCCVRLVALWGYGSFNFMELNRLPWKVAFSPIC